MTETRADKIIAAGRDGTVELEEALAAEYDKLERELAEAQERLLGDDRVQAQRDELAAENAALRELLKVARCPNVHCDNKGTIATYDGSGDVVPEQCQWCFERMAATEGHSQGPSVSALPPSEAQHLLASGDPLPCDVTCEGFGTFHQGVKLGTLLGYLGRRRHYNTLPAPTEEQKAAFQRVLAEVRGESHMEGPST